MRTSRLIAVVMTLTVSKTIHAQSSAPPPHLPLPHVVALPPADRTAMPIPVKPPSPPVPKGNQDYWITEDDYPDNGPWLGKPKGEVKYRLLVGIDGRPISCDVSMRSGSVLLDKTTCDLVMRRARFSPAVDERGQSAVGTWHGTARWTISPNAELRIPKLPIPGESIITYVIDLDGKAKDCKVESGPNPATFMLWAMPCDFNQVFPVQHNAQSQPAQRRVRLVLTVQDPDMIEDSGP